MPQSDHDHKELCRDWALYALYELLSQKFERLEQKLHNLQITMSQVSDKVDALKAQNVRLQAAFDGVSADITSIKDLVAQLQATQGQLTPEDQALLDQLTAETTALADKFEALDALTPPVVPPTP